MEIKKRSIEDKAKCITESLTPKISQRFHPINRHQLPKPLKAMRLKIGSIPTRSRH